MDDPYLSSSPSINEEEIDFQYVYALRTFVATEQGQANVQKGDAMILLNDSNSYWWLVRLVKDSSVGFLPAEHVETPSERLARLNKHRNGEVSSPASFSYSARHNPTSDSESDDDHSNKNHVRLPNSRLKKPRQRSANPLKKSVTFTQNLTYVSASEYDFTEEEVGEDDEFEYSDFEESDEEIAQQHEQHHHEQLIQQSKQNQLGENQDQVQTQTIIDSQDPLVIRKPRSNSNSPQSSSTNIVTNSDDEGEEPNDSTNPRRVETEDSRKPSGLFSLMSRTKNRKTSGLAASPTEAPAPAHTAVLENTLQSESNHSRQISKESVQSMDSVIHHPTIGSDGSQKRRSLLTTKSSTEQLKRKPSQSSQSSIDSPVSSHGPNVVKPTLTNRQTIANTSNSPSLGNSSENSSSRSSPSSTHSQSSSATSPDITNNSQPNIQVNAPAPIHPKETHRIAKILANGSTPPLKTNRFSMYETKSELTVPNGSGIPTPRGRLNMSARQTHSEIYSNNPFRASMAGDLESTAPLNTPGLRPIFQGKSIQGNDLQVRGHGGPSNQSQKNKESMKSDIEENKQFIPERIGKHTPLVRPSEQARKQENPKTELADRPEGAASSTVSLPLSISSDRGMRSGSAATVSTSPSSPTQEQDDSKQSQEEKGYMAGIINSAKIHPDIVPIYKETSVRLDLMNAKLTALLNTYH